MKSLLTLLLIVFLVPVYAQKARLEVLINGDTTVMNETIIKSCSRILYGSKESYDLDSVLCVTFVGYPSLNLVERLESHGIIVYENYAKELLSAHKTSAPIDIDPLLAKQKKKKDGALFLKIFGAGVLTGGLILNATDPKDSRDTDKRKRTSHALFLIGGMSLTVGIFLD